jgi:hypothetical protein
VAIVIAHRCVNYVISHLFSARNNLYGGTLYVYESNNIIMSIACNSEDMYAMADKMTIVATAMKGDGLLM